MPTPRATPQQMIKIASGVVHHGWYSYPHGKRLAPRVLPIESSSVIAWTYLAAANVAMKTPIAAGHLSTHEF